MEQPNAKIYVFAHVCPVGCQTAIVFLKSTRPDCLVAVCAACGFGWLDFNGDPLTTMLLPEEWRAHVEPDLVFANHYDLQTEGVSDRVVRTIDRCDWWWTLEELNGWIRTIRSNNERKNECET
jgi:hypothetical protein